MGTLSSTVARKGSKPSSSVKGTQCWVQKRSWEEACWRETARCAVAAADRWSAAKAIQVAGVASAKAVCVKQQNQGRQEGHHSIGQNTTMQHQLNDWLALRYKTAVTGTDAGAGGDLRSKEGNSQDWRWWWKPCCPKPLQGCCQKR